MTRINSLIATTLVLVAGVLATTPTTATATSSTSTESAVARATTTESTASTTAPSPSQQDASGRDASGSATPRSRCGTSLAQTLASTGHSTQLVTAVAPSYTSTHATLEAWRREGPCWVRVLGPWNARIGYAGFSDYHLEDDGTTPTGAYGIGPVMYGNAPNPGVRYRYHRLVCGDWWDEDPRSSGYNTFQHVACGTPPPFGGDSEALWEEAAAYPSFAVVEYNTAPIVPGAGSAIFIHADIGSATDGCVSLPLGALDQLLRWMDPASAPIVVMGPSSEIESF